MMHTPLFAASMMAADAARLGEELGRLPACGVDILHWDIMDGHFVPNLTFGPHILGALRPLTPLQYDVHLMVADPAHWLEKFIDSGADVITFHIEAASDPLPLLAAIRERGCKAGLAINPATPLSAIPAAAFAQIDRLLVMTVNPGFGGQAFIDQSQKIRMARKNHPHLDIMVDGGINPVTAPDTVATGATSLVSGSAFFNADDRAAFVAQLKGV